MAMVYFSFYVYMYIFYHYLSLPWEGYAVLCTFVFFFSLSFCSYLLLSDEHIPRFVAHIHRFGFVRVLYKNMYNKEPMLPVVTITTTIFNTHIHTHTHYTLDYQIVWFVLPFQTFFPSPGKNIFICCLR